MGITFWSLFVLFPPLFHQAILQLAVSEEDAWHYAANKGGAVTSKGTAVTLQNGTEVVLYPAVQRKLWMMAGDGMGGDWRRRQLSAFGVCSACRCCDDTQTVCSLVACCFSIVCNAPNQPFGLCSLSPSACNCLSCPVAAMTTAP